MRSGIASHRVACIGLRLKTLRKPAPQPDKRLFPAVQPLFRSGRLFAPSNKEFYL